MSGLWFLDQVVAEASTTSEEGMAARAEGVTASEVHSIAVGSRGSWRRILDDKLNGSTFRGNQHTRRGHEREPFLLAYAGDLLGGVEPNAALLRHPDHHLHLATPDAFGIDIDRGGIVGVEVKSHAYGYQETHLPRAHVDQMQWGMWVTGAQWWLYVTEVMGEDGEPTLDLPRHVWVQRDDARIERLVAETDRFLAWRAAGAPEVDGDIPAHLDDALAEWAEGDAIERDGKARKAVADATIRMYLAEHPTAPTQGLKQAGSRAHFVYSVSEKEVLDEAAWEAAEPAGYAEWQAMSTAVAETAGTAALIYASPVRSTRLTITAKKEN